MKTLLRSFHVGLHRSLDRRPWASAGNRRCVLSGEAICCSAKSCLVGIGLPNHGHFDSKVKQFPCSFGGEGREIAGCCGSEAGSVAEGEARVPRGGAECCGGEGEAFVERDHS